MAYPTSQLGLENVLRDVHDPITQTLRTTATAIIAPGLDVDISHVDDSIRLGNGTSFLTSTTVLGKITLDVYVANPGINILDGNGNILTSQVNGSQRALDVGINVAGVQIDPRATRALTAADVVTANQGTGGTSAWKVDGSAVTQPVSAASLPLPTGAATSANQTTEISSLSSIDTKLTTTNSSLSSIDAGIPAALGQTTAANSMPVTLASDQPPISVSISGTATVDTEMPTAAALADATANPTTPLLGSAMEMFNGATWDRVRGDTTNGLFANIKTSVLPTGAATSALQTTGNASLASIDTKLTSPLSVAQSGTWTTGRTWSLLNTSDSVNVGNFPATQAVTQSTSPWITSNAPNTSGVFGPVTVTTSAVEAKVGGSPLASRKTLTVHNNGTGTIYWGYSGAVTTTSGTPIFKDQFVSWDIGPAVSVYLIASSGSQNVRVTENA